MPDLYDIFDAAARDTQQAPAAQRREEIVHVVAHLAKTRRRKRIARDLGVAAGTLGFAAALGWAAGEQLFDSDAAIASAPDPQPSASVDPPSTSEAPDLPWADVSQGWFVASVETDATVAGVRLAPSGLIDAQLMPIDAPAGSSIVAWQGGRALVWAPAVAGEPGDVSSDGASASARTPGDGDWLWWSPAESVTAAGSGRLPTAVLGALADGRWVQADAGSGFDTLAVADAAGVLPVCDTASQLAATALSSDAATLICFETRGDGTEGSDIVVVDLHDGAEKRLAATLPDAPSELNGVGWSDPVTFVFGVDRGAGPEYFAIDTVTSRVKATALPGELDGLEPVYHWASDTYSVTDTDGVSFFDAMGSRLARVDCEGSREQADVVASGFRAVVRCPATTGSGWVDSFVDLANGSVLDIDTSAVPTIGAYVPVGS